MKDKFAWETQWKHYLAKIKIIKKWLHKTNLNYIEIYYN